MFKAADKVICVDDNLSPFLRKGKTYTIKEVRGEFVDLEETGKGGYSFLRFRLAEEEIAAEVIVSHHENL